MYLKTLQTQLTHLIDNRLHIGHHEKNLARKMNSYNFAIRHDISIMDLRKTIWSLNYVFYNFTELFYYRNNILFVETEGVLPIKSLLETYQQNNLILSNNFINEAGFVQKEWVKGLLSNWKIIYDLLKHKNHKKGNKTLTRKLNALSGLKKKQNQPLLPDFIFVCNVNNSWAFKEMIKAKIPLFGLVDSNMNPEFFLYSILGNNDSIESIKFCLSLLMLSQKESMLQERKMLYYLILIKIKQVIKK